MAVLNKRRDLKDLRDWLKGLSQEDKAILAAFFGFPTGTSLQTAVAAGDARAFPDGIIKLLDWFVLHGPELLALIKEIMDLFLSMGVKP